MTVRCAYPRKAVASFTLLGSALFLGIILPYQAFAEWDEWITDASVGVEKIDNINHAISGLPYSNDEKNDTLLDAQVVYGRIFQAADFTRLIFTARLKGDAHQEYTRLNATTVGGSAVLFHKFGYGADMPWLRANLDLGYMDVGDNLRDSNLVNAGLRAGMGFMPWLDGWVGYEYFRRDGKDGDAVPASYSGTTYPLTSPTNVFDLVRNTFRVNLNINPLRDVTISTGYSVAKGDFTASCSAANLAYLLYYETSYKALALDGAFEDSAGNSHCVYRVDATATTAILGASYALGRHASVNVGYQQQKTKAKVYTYDTKVYSLYYLHTF